MMYINVHFLSISIENGVFILVQLSQKQGPVPYPNACILECTCKNISDMKSLSFNWCLPP